MGLKRISVLVLTPEAPGRSNGLGAGLGAADSDLRDLRGS
jgi:hypothetical protein